MKNKNFFYAIIFVLTAFIFSPGCHFSRFEKYEYKYDVYKPVYLPYEKLRASVQKTEPAPLINPGKIYIRGSRIYLNEREKGIHIIDNTDPSHPVRTGFIEIPGNIDMAIKDNILYADSYVDLVAIDLNNNCKVVKRLENLFIYRCGNYYNYEYQCEEKIDSSKGVVVRFDYDKTITEEYYADSLPMFMFGGTASESADSCESGSYGSSPGTGGSMARFTVYNDCLYTVTERELQVINIDNPRDPEKSNKKNIGFAIETIFQSEGYLYIGSQLGMYIYDAKNSPLDPMFVSRLLHVRSYDPVVAEGGYAYVTLRSRWAGQNNELLVIDIRDISEPQLIKEYSLQNPYGLGIDGNYLFICDGIYGLKIYDASDKNHLVMINNITGFETYDVIPFNGRLIVTGKKGLYQYDYSDINNIKLLSSILKQGA